MAKSIPSSFDTPSAESISVALGAFGITSAEAQIERLPQRVKNVNFRIRAGQRDWILKCHRAGGAVRNLGFSQKLELLLADAGFPVAKLQSAQSGQTLVRHGEMFFTLHAWVPGHQISIDQRDQTLDQYPHLVRELGSSLGRLHRIGEPLLTRSSTPVDVGWLLAGPRRTVTSIRRGRPPQIFKAARLRVRPRKSTFDQWILSRLPRLFDQANRLADEASTRQFHLSSGDTVVAHNDLNWENLIFDPAFKLLAMLDFDNATPLPRALDVGATAAVLVGSASGRIEEFLATYASESGKHVDRDLVNLGMRWKCVRSMLWSIDSYLSGRVADSRLVATWCSYLDDCLESIIMPQH